MHAPTGKQSHHVRFYIVMASLVVGGIFLILLINNDNNMLDITGNAVSSTILGESKNTTLTPTAPKRLSNEVPFQLTFNKIPDLKRDVDAKKIELKFRNAANLIYVNQDKLELNNLEEITLSIEDYIGEFEVGTTGLSLDGKARRLEVNGVSLSSKEKIPLRFTDLNFYTLNIEDITITNLALPSGEGQLTLADKLTYSLTGDSMSMDVFTGDWQVKADGRVTLDLDGQVQGVSLSGALLNVAIS